MTFPAFLFGALVASFMGAMVHLATGGGLSRLILYLLLGWAGFWSGHALGDYLGAEFLPVGPLHFGAALIGAVLLLALGYWLSNVKVVEK